MKLTSVELHPAGSSNVAVMSFRDPGRELPYNVKGITGLDAAEIIAKYYPGSLDLDKSFFNLAPVGREIVILVELNPEYSANETFSDLRDDLYRMISSSRTGLIEVQFKNGSTVVATVSGQINKFEGGHFTKTPEVQITLKCTDPLLRAPTPTVVDVSTLTTILATITDNLSTAPHGLIFELAVTAPVASLAIIDPDDDSWVFAVTPGGGFLAGDHIFFSSEYNEKYLYLVRAGDIYYLANGIISGSVWPIIFPGVNKLALGNPGSFSWVAMSHRPTYWGV